MTIIEELEEQVEHWRQRAEAAEAALRGDEWDRPVPPLSLYQTRILRLVLRKQLDSSALVCVLASDYPGTNYNSFNAQLQKMKQVVPREIVPRRSRTRGDVFVPANPDAAQAFLANGAIPDYLRNATGSIG